MIAMTRRTELQIEFNKSEKSLIHLKCRRRDIDKRNIRFFFQLRKFLIERNEDWKELRLFRSFDFARSRLPLVVIPVRSLN